MYFKFKSNYWYELNSESQKNNQKQEIYLKEHSNFQLYLRLGVLLNTMNINSDRTQVSCIAGQVPSEPTGKPNTFLMDGERPSNCDLKSKNIYSYITEWQSEETDLF